MEDAEKRHGNGSADRVPLVVDLDGTLVRSDLLQEGFLQLLARQPIEALKLLRALKEGRAAFKSQLAACVSHDLDLLPINATVLDAVRSARTAGRPVFLATAADRRWAQALADKLGIFDGVFASENGKNLRGEMKAEVLCQAFGKGSFDYIGNSSTDIPIWQKCRRPLLAGVSASGARRLTQRVPQLTAVDCPSGSGLEYLRALRPHQWTKNALVALPAIAAHVVSFDALVAVIIAFISFSLCASSVYLLNDMLDLAHDRAHAKKRHRPFASGLVPLATGAWLAGGLAIAAFVFASLLPALFLVALASYAALAVCYTLLLKRKLMIDVVALASLYGIRVIAGAAASAVVLSDWLVAFCFFLFLCLALVKRSTELGDLPEDSDAVKGRGYRRGDLATVNALASAGGVVSVLVLALYVNSPEVRMLYRHPQILWCACLLLVYWLGRVIVLTSRREMTLDPVVFAFSDRTSLLTGILVLAVVVLAV